MKKFLIIPLLLYVIIASGQEKKAENVQLTEGNIYYESYGEGKPLFLLHGYTQSSKYWYPYISDFIDDYQVILVDLPEHGQTSQLPKSDLSFDKIIELLNEFVKYLNIDQFKAIGYSFGGDLLFHWAANNPGLIESFVVIGSLPRNFKRDFPAWIEIISYKNKESFPWMSEYHRSEEQIKRILDLFENYDSSLENDKLSGIKARVLMVYGDNDHSIPLSEVSRVRELIPNTQLLIFPNTGHGAHEGENYKYFIITSQSFLGGD